MKSHSRRNIYMPDDMTTVEVELSIDTDQAAEQLRQIAAIIDDAAYEIENI